jgi:DNA modification methylase
MLIQADARALPLRDACVQCVVTSPPYFGLRDYGIAGQLGLEATPAASVAALIAVFREVRRVLKDDGVCWVNLGDSFATGAGRVGECPGGGTQGEQWRLRGLMTPPNRMPLPGLKSKDLIGIPWRVAFALQADGWYLRADIIWSKPNPMPESVTDRPTKAHEYLFLLSKRERYYYDAAAIREVAVCKPGRITSLNGPHVKRAAIQSTDKTTLGWNRPELGRNKRTVWTIPTMPYAGAHFATFPEALVMPCILAGSRFGDRICDPFLGSGTVGAVAERLGRRWVGTDLTYHDLSRVRTAQRGLRFDEAVSR